MSRWQVVFACTKQGGKGVEVLIRQSTRMPLQSFLSKVSWVVALGCSVITPSQAAWTRFGDVYGNADIWYDNKIDNKGSTSEIRTFMIYPVRAQVPLSDPKATNRDKVKLVTARSELSSYEFDCKNSTVQLKYRIFYADVDGKFMLVEHKAKDVFIADSNSSFAQQFVKRPVFPNNPEMVKTMNIACAKK
jgi:hypothetical protein